MPGVTSVVVVDDHTTFSELLARALDAEPDVTCVGTASSADEAITLVESTTPDVVFMDVRLGADDGIETTAKLTARDPDLRVIVLTASSEPELVQRAAAAGACCLLPKDGSLDDVLSAVRTARSGGLVVHPELLRALVMAPVPPRPTAQVTDRELQVLRQLAEGRSVRQIARDLSISEHTARGHVKKLLVKLDAHSQLEAVAIATRQGLLR